MQHLIESRNLRLTVNSLGAEMRSLMNLDSGREVLWQADPEVWSRTAPVLFPVVGKSKDARIRIDDTWHPMPQHGFARDQVFRLTESEQDKLLFVLEDTEETHAFYPLPFYFSIGYQLLGNILVTRYTVKNPGSKTLFFSLGAHPGFALPSERLEDYRLVFEQPETAERWLIREGLFSGETQPLLQNQQELTLSSALFRDDAIVLKNLASRELNLTGPDVQLNLRWKNFPYLGIWTKYPSESFICLEPWQGLADHRDTDGDITRREGIIGLEPGGTFIAGINISVEK